MTRVKGSVDLRNIKFKFLCMLNVTVIFIMTTDMSEFLF
jgi:hypothetical protein